ncbi:MAG: type II toxin-antitoxin system VapC family toxin [Planctomycetaceae bacterium]
MTRILIDTHAFLWFTLNDSRLSRSATDCMADPANELLFSPASYWEIAIKISIGRYSLPEDFARFMQDQIAENDLTILPVTVEHAAAVVKLPFHHRDPFDRLLAAQATVEGVELLSADEVFDHYIANRRW